MGLALTEMNSAFTPWRFISPLPCTIQTVALAAPPAQATRKRSCARAPPQNALAMINANAKVNARGLISIALSSQTVQRSRFKVQGYRFGSKVGPWSNV